MALSATAPHQGKSRPVFPLFAFRLPLFQGILPGLMKSLIPLPIRRSLGNWWNARQARAAKDRLLTSLRGNTVACNVCGWEGARFTDDGWHPGTICPNCGSQVRHRLLVAALDGRSSRPGVTEADVFSGRSLLHFAPERQLRDRLRRAASRYVTADFGRGDCDLRLDISRMPEVAAASFERVVVCDVLEHVPDDRAAFREILRVLAPGGLAVLTVPQKDPPAETDEDPTVATEGEREKRFGQKDHVRMYGDDFATRLAEAGFAVEILTVNDFPGTSALRHVLHPPEPNPNPLATNHRRIYFARKE